jgi:hypothetical protein
MDSLKRCAGAARRQIVPREHMTHTESDSNWQFSLDVDPDGEVLDYSKLLSRESNSEAASEAPRRRELRRPLARLLAGRFG